MLQGRHHRRGRRGAKPPRKLHAALVPQAGQQVLRKASAVTLKGAVTCAVTRSDDACFLGQFLLRPPSPAELQVHPASVIAPDAPPGSTEVIRIGRLPVNEIQVANEDVSGIHVEIRLPSSAATSSHEPKLQVRDLSANGTGICSGGEKKYLKKGSTSSMQNGSSLTLPMRVNKACGGKRVELHFHWVSLRASQVLAAPRTRAVTSAKSVRSRKSIRSGKSLRAAQSAPLAGAGAAPEGTDPTAAAAAAVGPLAVALAPVPEEAAAGANLLVRRRRRFHAYPATVQPEVSAYEAADSAPGAEAESDHGVAGSQVDPVYRLEHEAEQQLLEASITLAATKAANLAYSAATMVPETTAQVTTEQTATGSKAPAPAAGADGQARQLRRGSQSRSPRPSAASAASPPSSRNISPCTSSSGSAKLRKHSKKQNARRQSRSRSPPPLARRQGGPEGQARGGRPEERSRALVRMRPEGGVGVPVAMGWSTASAHYAHGQHLSAQQLAAAQHAAAAHAAAQHVAARHAMAAAAAGRSSGRAMRLHHGRRASPYAPGMDAAGWRELLSEV